MAASNQAFPKTTKKDSVSSSSSSTQAHINKLPTEVQTLTKSFLTTLPDLINLSKISSAWNKDEDHQAFIQSEYAKRMKFYFRKAFDSLTTEDIAEEKNDQKPCVIDTDIEMTDAEKPLPQISCSSSSSLPNSSKKISTPIDYKSAFNKLASENRIARLFIFAHENMLDNFKKEKIIVNAEQNELELLTSVGVSLVEVASKYQKFLDYFFGLTESAKLFFYDDDKLLWGVSCNQLKFVKDLLCVEEFSGASLDSVLFLAASRGFTLMLKELLEQKEIDVNDAVEERSLRTALWIAAYNGQTECVNVLLARKDIDVNKADMHGVSPLLGAIFHGHTECVKALLAKERIDINTETQGLTPLSLAVVTGQVECVKALLAKEGIDINKANADGVTPLYAAIINGRIECFKLLLAEKKIDIKKTDRHSATLLLAAVNKGHVEFVKALLARNELDINDKEELTLVTPLLEAICNNHKECFNALLENKNIDINKEGSHDELTPLMLIVSRDGFSEQFEALLARKELEVNKTNKFGQTALWIAARFGKVDYVEALLAQKNIDVNKANKYGKTPLWIAASEGNADCVKLLLAEKDVDMTKTNILGQTPLHVAVINGHIECVEALLTSDKVKADEINAELVSLYDVATNDKIKILILNIQLDQFIKKASITEAKAGSSQLFHSLAKGTHVFAAKALKAAIKSGDLNNLNSYYSSFMESFTLRNIYMNSMAVFCLDNMNYNKKAYKVPSPDSFQDQLRSHKLQFELEKDEPKRKKSQGRK